MVAPLLIETQRISGFSLYNKTSAPLVLYLYLLNFRLVGSYSLACYFLPFS